MAHGVDGNPRSILFKYVPLPSPEKIQDFFRSVYDGAASTLAHEKKRAYEVFSLNPNVRRLQDVFDKYFPKGIFQESPVLTALKERLSGISFAGGEEGAAFLGNEEALHGLSYLREEGREDREISPEAFKAIMEGAEGEQETAFTEIVDYIVARAPHAPQEEIADALRSGRDRREVLAMALKGIPPEEMDGKLTEAATSLATKLAEMDGDGHLLFMGKAGAQKVGIGGLAHIPFVGDMLPEVLKQVLDGDDPEAVGKMIKDTLLEQLAGNPGGEAVLGKGAAFKELIDQSFAQMNATLDANLPETWAAAIVKSLKEDARELVCGVRSEGGDASEVEKIYDRVVDNGFEEAVEQAVGEVIVGIRDLFNGKMDHYVGKLTKHLPSSMLTLLSAQGLVPHVESPFWVDVTQGAEGKYTVKLYANGLGAEAFPELKVNGKAGIQVPLIFEGVDASKLTQDFFFRLLAYEYWPKSEEDIKSYSVEDVVSGVIEYLGEPKVGGSLEEIVPHALVEKRGDLSLMHLFLFHNQDQGIEAYYSEASFDVSLQAFIDHWKQHGDFETLIKDKHLRAQFRKGIDHLSREAISLHTDGAITDGKLQKVYATIWEIGTELHRAETNRVTPKTGGVIVPPLLQERLKDLLLVSGMDPSYLSFLKESFLVAAGEENEELFDAALAEILPEVVTSKAFKETEVKSWEEILRLDTVREKMEYLKINRPSVLQFIKFYLKLGCILFSLYRLSLAAKTIAKAIEKSRLGIKNVLPFSPYYIGLMVAIFGPYVFRKILPKDAYDSLAAIYKLANEASWYVFNRLLMTLFKGVLKQVINHNVNQEDLTLFREQAQEVNKGIFRKGEMSYEVGPSNTQAGIIDFPVVAPGAVPAASDEVAFPIFNEGIPKPAPVVLTAGNCAATLTQWGTDVATLRALGHDKSDRYALAYLNEQIRNLPIPYGDDEEVWRDLEHPDEVVERVHTLLCQLYACSENSGTQLHQRTETVISFYTLYAIIDTLAKEYPGAELNDFEHAANGADLMHFTQMSGLKISKEKSLQKLRDVCEYFGFEFGKRYTKEEIEAKHAMALFNHSGSGASLLVKPYNGDGQRDGGVTINPFRAALGFDHSYFNDLLENPEIQRRLAAHGLGPGASRFEKRLALFRDPPMSAAPAATRDSLAMGTHEEDLRKGIVPRSFYILRLAHLMCSTRSIFRDGVPETFNPDDHAEGLTFPEYHLPEPAANNLGGRLSAFVARQFHRASRGVFESRRMEGSLGVISREDERVKRIEKRCLGRDVGASSSEHVVGASQSSQERYEEAFFEGKRADLSAIDKNPLLTTEEKKLLKMVQSHDSDRLIRALSFFSYSKDRLRHPEFRVLFDLLCQNLMGLEAQRSEHAAISKDVGRFFRETLEHFRGTGDLETSLYMIKVGIELEAFFGSHGDDGREGFPDFAQEIREHILPAYHALPHKQRNVRFGENSQVSGILLALSTLAASYQNVDYDALSLEKKRVAEDDMARFTFFQGKGHVDFFSQDIMLKGTEVAYRWSSRLPALFENAERREAMMATLFQDAEIALDIDGEWEGEFPIIRNGDLEVDFSKRTIAGHSTVYIKEQGEELLRKIFNQEELPEEGVFIGNNEFAYFDLGVRIRWNEADRNFQVRRQLEDGTYAEYFPQENLNFIWSYSPFAFEEHDAVFVGLNTIYVYRNNVLFAEFETEANVLGRRVTHRRRMIDGVWHEAVDLTRRKQGLTLLNWFSDLKDIEAYSREGSTTLSYFRIPSLGLEFKVEENEEGVLRAVSQIGETKGYFLAKRQDDNRLYPYPHAIILHNDAGGEKVLLKTISFPTLFTEFAAKSLGRQKTSPFIDHMIQKVLGKQAEGMDPAAAEQFEKLMQSHCYSLHFDDEGELTSTDPEVIAYLTLFHFCHGDMERMSHYFDQLELYGRQRPYSEQLFKTIDYLTYFLSASLDPKAGEFVLRLAAVREENILIQQPDPEDGEGEGLVALGVTATFDIQRSLGIQERYVMYLENIKFGGRQYLRPEDELFIFKTITRTATDLFEKAGSGRSEITQKWMGRAGSFASERLLPPVLVRRLHYLREKFEKGIEEQTLNEDQRFMAEAFWQDKSNPCIQFLDKPKRGGALSQLDDLVKDVAKSPYLKLLKPREMVANAAGREVPSIGTQLDYSELLRNPTYTLEEVPVALADLKPELLQREFLHYYRLVRGELPPEWDRDVEKSTLFHQKSKQFLQNLPLLKGNIDPKKYVFFDLLYRVSKGSRVTDFVTADQIRIEMLAMTEGVTGLQARLAVLEGQWEQVRVYEPSHRSTVLNRARTLMGMPEDHMVVKDYNPYGKEIRYIEKKLKKRPADGANLYPKDEFNALIESIATRVRLLGSVEALRSIVTVGNAVGVAKNAIWFAGGVRKVAAFGPRVFAQAVVYPNYVAFRERARGIFRVVRPVAEAAPAESTEVSPELATALRQREGNINDAMRGILETFYTHEEEEAPPLPELPPYPEDQDDAALREGFKAFNRTLADYYARARGKTLSIRLKEGQSPEEFVGVLRGFQEHIGTILEQEREAIVTFVNQENIDADDETERTLARLHKVRAGGGKLSFDDVLKWFLSEDDAIMLSRSEVKEENLPELREKMFLYLIAASRFNLLFKEIEKADPTQDLIPVAEELLRERVYTFDAGGSERLLKAKLVYEARTGRLLWKVPTEQLDAMILSGNPRSVDVVIMGSGKSSFIVPTSDYVAADGKQVVINVWPKSVLKDNLELMGEVGYGVFGQSVNAFSIDRQRNWTSERLWALLKVLERSVVKKEQVNLTQEDLQALQLRFIEESIDSEEKFRADPAEHQKRIGLYKKILRLIREHGRGNIDEIHEATREDKELNFPIGARQTLKRAYAESLETVLLQLMSLPPELAALLTIKDEEPKSLDAAVFAEHIAPAVAQRLVALEKFHIPEDKREEFADYLCGQSEEIPASVLDHPDFRELALMRGALIVLLPKSLERIMHKHYNVASEETGLGYVKPSEGNVNTVDESDLLSPYDTFVKTCLLLLHDRLADAQVKEMIPYLKSKAESESEKIGVHFEQTPTAIHFREILCPGIRLSDVTDENVEEHIETLRASDALTLAYARQFIREQIKHFPRILESNGQDFINMFSTFFSHTGTPDMDLCPDGTEEISQGGILGESLDTFERKVSDVKVFEASKPSDVLDEMIATFFRAHPYNRVIIDRGAALNGLTTTQVATRLQQYILAERPDLKGIAFYIKDQAMIIDRAGVIRPLSQCKMKPEERLTYFDEAHSYAANVPQMKEACALLTVGETTKVDGEIDQAEWRMRGLHKLNQSLVLGMTKHVRSKAIEEERVPTPREMIAFMRTNGIAAKKMRNYHIDSQKLHSAVKRAILDIALKADTPERTMQILRDYEESMVSRVSDDPIALFAAMKVSKDPKVVLKEVKRVLLAQVTAQIHFSPAERAQLEYILTGIIEGQRFKLGEELYDKARHLILQKADGAAAEELSRRILTHFQALLTTDHAQALIAFFTDPAVDEPLEAIKAMLMVPVNSSPDFTDEEKAAFREELDAIIAKEVARPYPETVEVFEKGDELSSAALDAMGRAVAVQADAVQDEEADEEEQDEDLNNVNNLAQAGLNPRDGVSPAADIGWSESLDPTNLEQWFSMVNPRTYTFSRLGSWREYTPPLFHLREGFAVSQNEAVREMAQTLPASISCSWNLFKVFASNQSQAIDPFSEKQKPILEFLLVQEGANQKILLLTQEDAAFWRRKLTQDRASVRDEHPDVKLALVDSLTGAVVATGKNGVTTEEANQSYTIRRARTVMKFLSGYTTYTDDQLVILERWMKAKGVERAMNFFKPIAYGLHQKEPYMGSNLQRLVMKLEEGAEEPELLRI